MKRIFIGFTVFLFYCSAAFAAVGCDLNDPDRDVKRLFPGSTGYKTSYQALDKKGGEKLLSDIEERLGDKFRGMYETVGVPYTLYEVHKGKAIAGYIHGVNQKGVYGGIQVFLALDGEGTIKAFYIQKLTSKQAAKFKEPSFAKKFEGLSLKDFYAYNVPSGKFDGAAPEAFKQDSGAVYDADTLAVMRAVKKNLVLMDEFVFNNKNLRYLKKGE